MAKYIEAFSGKLDWAMPFQRTGAFPLDRSSMFESYEDALAYAKQDLTDSRKLGANSYVGQLIVVYGKDAGVAQPDGTIKYTDEVAGYIITAVGESASLMKLAQTTATGDFASDINALNTALGALETRVKDVEDAIDALEKDTDTTYEFLPATDTDGAIKYIAKNKSGATIGSGEVQVKGWAELQALASGRNKAHVYANKNDSNYLTAIGKKASFKVGDVIYFTDKNIPDEWVSTLLDTAVEGSYYIFYELETTKVDLSNYYTETEADAKFATKNEVNSKASQTDLNNLNTSLNNYKTEVNGKLGTVKTNVKTGNVIPLQSQLGDVKTNSETGEVISLQSQIDNINVSDQIDDALTELNVSEVGGAGKYIKSIKQVNGKIDVVAEALPDYTEVYDAKGAADQALTDAKAYTDEVVGEIPEGETVKEYVDRTVGDVSNEITKEGGIASRITNIETAVTSTTNTNSHASRISALETAVGTNTSNITNISSRLDTVQATANKAKEDIASLTTKVTDNTTAISLNSQAISTLQSEVAGRVKEIQLGGVKQTMTEAGVVNITEVSTDLLKTGSNVLILDCLNASLTDNA